MWCRMENHVAALILFHGAQGPCMWQPSREGTWSLSHPLWLGWDYTVFSTTVALTMPGKTKEIRAGLGHIVGQNHKATQCSKTREVLPQIQKWPPNMIVYWFFFLIFGVWIGLSSAKCITKYKTLKALTLHYSPYLIPLSVVCGLVHSSFCFLQPPGSSVAEWLVWLCFNIWYTVTVQMCTADRNGQLAECVSVPLIFWI